MYNRIITPQLIKEIEIAFDQVGDYGSVEIYVQGHQVTQITSRKIRKTNHQLNGHGSQSTSRMAHAR